MKKLLPLAPPPVTHPHLSRLPDCNWPPLWYVPALKVQGSATFDPSVLAGKTVVPITDDGIMLPSDTGKDVGAG